MTTATPTPFATTAPLVSGDITQFENSVPLSNLLVAPDNAVRSAMRLMRSSRLGAVVSQRARVFMSQHDVLKHVVGGELNFDSSIVEVGTQRVDTLDVNRPPADLLHLFAMGRRHVPIVRGGKVRGVMFNRQVLTFLWPLLRYSFEVEDLPHVRDKSETRFPKMVDDPAGQSFDADDPGDGCYTYALGGVRIFGHRVCDGHLDIELGEERKVEDSMASDLEPVTIPESATLGDAVELLKEWAKRHVYVVDGRRLLGIVTEWDCLSKAFRQCEENGSIDLSTPITDVMSAGLGTVAPEDPVSDALEVLSNRRIGQVPVVQDGELVGDIVVADLIDHVANMFAGDILCRDPYVR